MYFSMVFESGGREFEPQGQYSIVILHLKPVILSCTGILELSDVIPRALQRIINTRATLARLASCLPICLAHFLPLPPAVTHNYTVTDLPSNTLYTFHYMPGTREWQNVRFSESL